MVWRMCTFIRFIGSKTPLTATREWGFGTNKSDKHAHAPNSDTLPLIIRGSEWSIKNNESRQI